LFASTHSPLFFVRNTESSTHPKTLMSSSDAMRSAISRVSKDTSLVPTTKLLQAVASAGVKFVDKGEALKAAAARVAATSSRYGDRLAAVSMTGVLSKALPHPGIGVLHTGGERDGASLGKVGAPLVAPGEVLKEGKGVKRPRGGEGPPEPTGAVSLAGGECAPLLRTKAGGGAKSARGWFDLPAPPMTLELKRELLILRNRNFLDPTRRYKTSREDREKLPKHFSIGTVVDSAGEGQSKRLSKAERRPTLLASLQSDPVFQDYANRTMAQVRERAVGGGISAYREKKAAAGADWKKKRAAYKAAHKGGKKSKGKKLY
jgi:hypothetical protein